MAGQQKILGFDIQGNFPVDQKRFVVADEAARLAIEWVYEGLKTYQKDTNATWQCLVDVKTNAETPFTEVADWVLVNQNGADGADGTIWYYDNGTPDVGTGVNGDFFLDFDKGNIYVKIAGTWELQLNIIGDRYATTSTSSVLIGTGAKTFTVGTGLAYTSQQSILIVDNAAPATNNMEATVTSYNPTTGSLVADVLVINGSGTLADWTINLDGATGSQGNPFEVDGPNVTLSDSLVTTIEGTSGATSADPYVLTVLNDTRTAATQRTGIEGTMVGNSIAYNGTSWRNYGTWRGPTGATGPNPSGSTDQTLRYSATDTLTASDALKNNGSQIAIAGAAFEEALNVTGNVKFSGSLRCGITKIIASGLPSAYPLGHTYFSVSSGDGYPLNDMVIDTYRQSSARIVQFAYGVTQNRIFVRTQTTTTSDTFKSFFEITGLQGKTAGIARLVNGTTGEMSTSTTVDYNTEVANKPTIAVAATSGETNAEVLTNVYVAPSTLGTWWTNVKASIQTFAAKITFTIAPRFSSVTASQFLKVDANKDLTSVATITNADISISGNDKNMLFNNAGVIGTTNYVKTYSSGYLETIDREQKRAHQDSVGGHFSLEYYRSRGTESSPTAVLLNDSVLRRTVYVYNGSNYAGTIIEQHTSIGGNNIASSYSLGAVNMKAVSGIPYVGFLGASAIVRPTVSGSTDGNVALQNLLTSLANLGLITNSTT